MIRLTEEKHLAFEIEVIDTREKTRKNYVYEYNPNVGETGVVRTYETTRIFYKPDKYEEEVSALSSRRDTFEHFKRLYRQALDKWCFLGWVDPNTFKPLEE